MSDLDLSKKCPEEIASQLEYWYPNKPGLINCARWLRHMEKEHPERSFKIDCFSRDLAITLALATTTTYLVVSATSAR